MTFVEAANLRVKRCCDLGSRSGGVWLKLGGWCSREGRGVRGLWANSGRLLEHGGWRTHASSSMGKLGHREDSTQSEKGLLRCLQVPECG